MKKDSLEKKLAAYVATAAAFLAAQKESNAQIMYTNVNPNDSIHSWPYPDRYIDLNNDGAYDFQIHTEALHHTSTYYGDQFYSNFVSAIPNQGNYNVVDGLPLKLNYGDQIGPLNPLGISQKLVFYKSVLAFPDNQVINQSGNWVDTSIGFLGVKFSDINGANYFGWIRLKIIRYSESEVGVIVYDFAYDTIANEQILAGQFYPTSVEAEKLTSINYSIQNKTLLFHLADNSLLGNQIEIINELGQLVSTVTVSNQNPEADLSALPSGIYFFHIRSKQKTYSGKFFIE